MYIEDLIQKVVIHCMFLFDKPALHNFSVSKDYSILDSMNSQIELGNALTEKQGALALRILNSHRQSLSTEIEEYDTSIDNPKWKHPFRTLLTVREVNVIDGNILIQFPFDQSLVDYLRDRNSRVHELYRGSWDNAAKAWKYALTEKNVLWLGDVLSQREFKFSEEFTKLYDQIKEVRDNLEEHIPMLTFENNKYVIKNAHKFVTQLDSDNLIASLFNARNQGINTWDDGIQALLDEYDNNTTKRILLSNRKENTWFNSDIIKIDEFEDLISHGGNVLIIVPGGSELALTRKWVNFANSCGIKNKDISVMFRLPNNQSEFNEYVKEAELNNPITDSTKMVFVSTKITKPLIKAGIKFQTAINLGYYNYMHFTMNLVVDNVCNLVYYSMKAPVENKKWRPQEL